MSSLSPAAPAAVGAQVVALRGLLAFAALSALLPSPVAAQFAITPSGDATTLANALLGSGGAVTITSATYTGAATASGTYTSGPLSIADGIIITSGSATNALPPNASGSTTTSNGLPGDTLCSQLTSPQSSLDAARLDLVFDLALGFDGISFQLIFGSEEYPEFVGSTFNDSVGVWLNGTTLADQVAFDPGGSPININGPFFASAQVVTPPTNGMEYDGSTPLLTAQTGLVGGSTGNTLSIVVCDAGDRSYDSGALLSGLAGCVGNDCDTGVVLCEDVNSDSDAEDSCTDCDDNDANVFTGAPELCDALDNDCDGIVPADEADGDGDGEAGCDGDCDDTNASINTSASEICNGLDDNCDLVVPADEADGDGDGFAPCDGDCDDNNANVFPGGPELCDGLDNDCDGVVPANEIDGDGDGVTLCQGDCDDNDGGNFPGNTESCDGADNDCDGSVPADEIDGDGDGESPCEGDCADGDAAINTSAAELCDGIDNDCNGTPDFAGGEGDGDGDGSLACADCDDADAANFPGNAEACDGQDNDCNTLADFAGETTDLDGDASLACADCDDADAANFPGNVEACDGQDNDCNLIADAVGGEFDGDADGSLSCVDCDDADPANLPGNVEICDGQDNDCDTDTTFFPSEEDLDGDDSPACADCDDTDPLNSPDFAESCDGLDKDCDGVVPDTEIDDDGDGAADCEGDCDDTDPTVIGGTPEICDGLDNNCDTVVPVDEIDDDGDGMSECEGDCDDADPTAFAGAPELCDRIDNDCDGALPADELDGDGDTQTPCEGDCNDADATVSLGAVELCNAVDDDCDGVVPADETDSDGDGTSECDGDCDDAEPTVYAGAPELCDGLDNDCNGVVPADEVDVDGDGVSECQGDCDESNPTVHASAPELCDGLDNDCDGVVPSDEADLDGDGVPDCQQVGDDDDSAIGDDDDSAVGDDDDSVGDDDDSVGDDDDSVGDDDDATNDEDPIDGDDDDSTIGETGGCNCPNAGQTPPVFDIQGSGVECEDCYASLSGPSSRRGTLAMVLGLGLVGLVRRRRSANVIVPAVLVAALLLPVIASAAEPDLGFHPTAQRRSFIVVRDATHRPDIDLTAQLGVDYTLRPLEAGEGYGPHALSIIDHQLGLDLGLSLGLTERLQIGLRVPFLNVQGGPDEGFEHAMAFGHSGRRVGFGDVGVDIAVGVLQQGLDDSPLSLTVVPRFVFPTGQADMWEGGGAMYAGGDLAIGGRWGVLHAMGNFGFAVALNEVGVVTVHRDNRSPREIGGSLGWDDHFRWGVGVGLSLAKGQIEPQVELVGSTVIAPEFLADANSTPFAPATSPLEILVGALIQPHKTGPVWFRVGAGRGMTPGFGSPDLRVFANVGVDVLLKKRGEDEVEVVQEEPSPEAGPAQLAVDVQYRGKHLADTAVVLRETEGEERRVTVGNEALVLEVEPNSAWTGAASRDCLNGTGSAAVDDVEGQLIVTMEADRTVPIDFDLRDKQGESVPDATVRWNQDPNCIGCVPEEKAAIASGQLRQMVCPGEHEVYIEKPGYRIVRSVITADAGTAHQIGVEMAESQVELGDNQIIILQKVYFDFDLADLQTRSNELLDEVADTIRAHPELGRLEVAGHTDARGDDAYNQSLSQRRAEAVLQYLVRKGVDSTRLTAVGYGETKPLDTNDTDAGRDKNRRVEFTILGE